MSQPRRADSVGNKRLYTWKTGEKFWSVTTIIGGGMPKPALLPWGIKTVSEYAVANTKRLYAMVEATDGDPEALQGVVSWLKGSPYRERDKAADLGSRIHEAAEAYRLGKPMPEWPDDVRPYMEQFDRFLHAFHPSFEAVEESVYSRSQRYAGTLDAILTLSDGTRLLVDYKTGKAIYPEVALQLAAYRFAEFMGLPDGSEAEVPPVDGCAALHLQPESFQLIDVRADEEVFKTFLYVREVFRFQEEIAKTVIGDALLPTATMEVA